MMIAGFSALFVLSSLITLTILLSGRNDGVAVEEPDAGRLQGSSIEQIIDDFSSPGAQSRDRRRRPGKQTESDEFLSVQDFMLPQVIKEDSSEPYLLRPRLERWSAEQVDRYWIPLEDIALDLLRRENDRRIETLFEDIP